MADITEQLSRAGQSVLEQTTSLRQIVTDLDELQRTVDVLTNITGQSLALVDPSRPLSRRRSPNSPPEICPPKIRWKNYGAPN